MTQRKSHRDTNSAQTTHKRKHPTVVQGKEDLEESILNTLPIATAVISTEPEFFYRNAVVSTDAGNIDFSIANSLQIFPGLLQGLCAIDPENYTFELLNGSKWSASNIEAIRGWTETDQLILSQNQALFSTHRFALVNLRLGKAVPITLLREPRPIQIDSFFITKLDLANDVVRLDQGQEWSVYSHDQGTLRKFSEHDRVLIGMNTSSTFLVEQMRYILIDTASNLYVRAHPLAL